MVNYEYKNGGNNLMKNTNKNEASALSVGRNHLSS